MGVTVKQLLATLCLKQGDAFAPCASLDAEWRVVKRAYFKAVLVHHPDKGGDAAAFQATQTAFEALREMMATGDIGVSFATSTAVSASGSATGDAQAGGEGVPPPSWEYYAEAAEASVPIYCVEPARSGRSKCSAKGAAVAHCSGGGEQPLISKGELRVGSIEGRSGGYGRWVHLHCWRLPSAIWLGLPDCSDPAATDAAAVEVALASMNEVLLCGFDELDAAARAAVVAHCSDKKHWARRQKRKQRAIELDDGDEDGSDAFAAASSSSSSSGGGGSSSGGVTSAWSSGWVNDGGSSLRPPKKSTALARQGHHGKPRERFAMPVPGQHGARPNALRGKTCVLTGVFPELGGGAGLNLGKDRCKGLITAFGGRVTGSISGRTDILVVGKTPGYSKVSKARATGKVQLMSLRDLKETIEGLTALEDVAPMMIDPGGFSAGYCGNGLATHASGENLAIACGTPVPMITAGGGAQKFAAKKTKAKAEGKKKKKKYVPPPAKKRAKMAAAPVLIDLT